MPQFESPMVQKLRVFILMAIFIPWLFDECVLWAFPVGNADFNVKAGATGTYDSNITFVNTNVKDDFITRLNIGAEYAYEGKTRQFKLGGNIYENIFLSNHIFNNTAEDLNFDLKNEFSKADRMTLSESFSNSQEPRSFEDAFGRTQGRYSIYQNAVSVDYSRDLTEQFGSRVFYANQVSFFSRKDLLDSWLNDAGLEAFYSFSSSTMVLVRYEFFMRTFENGLDASTHGMSAGVRQYFTKKLYFDGFAGVDRIRSFDNQYFTKPSLTGTLTHELSRTTQFKVSATKRYDTTTYTQSLFDQGRVSMSLSHDFTPKISGAANAFYGEGKYLSEGRTDKTRGVGVSASYEIKHDIRANVNYSYSSTDSNIDSGDYKKHTVTVGITVLF